MKKIIKALGKAACVLLAFAFVFAVMTGCASKKGKTLMTIGDKTLSVNEYQFFMTRVKGRMYYEGYEINNANMWNTIINTDGLTYDEYRCQTVREQAMQYLIADYIFSEKGLSLTDEETAQVEETMKKLVEKAGSKNSLNSTLSSYGVNYNMLYDIYMMEARINALKNSLYGEKGEKIEQSVKDEYFEGNYVCFEQLFLRGYEYSHELDKNGDSVYYSDDKYNHIAYDKENGVTIISEFGSEIKDEFGDAVYFTDDTAKKIAYDKQGELKYNLNSSGDKISVKYDDAKLKELEEQCKSFTASVTDLESFRALAREYDESGSDLETKMYLYSGYDKYYESVFGSAYSYFDKISEALKNSKTGECVMVKSDYGFHIVYKLDNGNGDYDNSDYSDAFSDFYDGLISKLFYELCQTYTDKVTVDESVWRETPDMKSVAANTGY